VRWTKSTLDKIDLSRQVARNFETDFLLAHSGFRPNFHRVSSKALNCFPVLQAPPRAYPIGAGTFFVRVQSADRMTKVKRAPGSSLKIMLS
jgi:hypothetical protein